MISKNYSNRILILFCHNKKMSCQNIFDNSFFLFFQLFAFCILLLLTKDAKMNVCAKKTRHLRLAALAILLLNLKFFIVFCFSLRF